MAGLMSVKINGGKEVVVVLRFFVNGLFKNGSF